MIKTQSLSKLYGDKVAVVGLDLEVRAGELFCMLGPNGAGKTTTLRMLTGLLRPTGGSAQVGGFDIVRQNLEAKALLGYVPDRPFLYDRLTGRELMRFVGGLYGMEDGLCETRSKSLLDTYGLGHAHDQLIGTYSHGMRQKLSFAACFLHQPKVVVIDEPWVGLDPRSIRRIKDDLRQRAASGLTVLMSTHTLSIAEELADRVGIFHQGRLLRVGTVDEIKAIASRPGSLEDVFLELTAEAAREPLLEATA
jgi:ABC-2 type transport system ATP-binding protein